MLDKIGTPWLIEVNTNPCLEESSKLLKQLMPRMIDDAFKLTLD
jgi:D-alanine-D-alanine ligase-like ATP-grasp enzyme